MIIVIVKVGNGYDIHCLPPVVNDHDFKDYFDRYGHQVDHIYDYSQILLGD